MRHIKNELQSIIIGNGQDGQNGQLKKVCNFLSRNAETSAKFKDQKHLKSEENSRLIEFALAENLFFSGIISQDLFLSEGAEQKVYRFDNQNVIKTNEGVFYENWLDYFHSLLVHNYFFKSTFYQFLGFKIINNILLQ